MGKTWHDGIYMFFHDLFHLTGRDLLAGIGLHRLGEKVFQRINTEIRLHIFTVTYPGNSGDIISRTLRYVFQDHGMEGSLIACQEKVPL